MGEFQLKYELSFYLATFPLALKKSMIGPSRISYGIKLDDERIQKIKRVVQAKKQAKP